MAPEGRPLPARRPAPTHAPVTRTVPTACVCSAAACAPPRAMVFAMAAASAPRVTIAPRRVALPARTAALRVCRSAKASATQTTAARRARCVSSANNDVRLRVTPTAHVQRDWLATPAQPAPAAAAKTACRPAYRPDLNALSERLRAVGFLHAVEARWRADRERARSRRPLRVAPHPASFSQWGCRTTRTNPGCG